jgi:hypothetical protein
MAIKASLKPSEKQYQKSLFSDAWYTSNACVYYG